MARQIDYTRSDCTASYAACEVWAHADRLGSTVKTSDSLGNEIDAYTYSKFGESGPEGDSGFPFRFTGQRLEAATGLYYYKARWYDPETGRFLQTDPIGYGDGMNMYAYVGNDPVNATDPTGLLKTRSCIEGSCGDWQESGGGGDFGGAVAFDWGSGSGDSFGSHSGFGFGGGSGASAPPKAWKTCQGQTVDGQNEQVCRTGGPLWTPPSINKQQFLDYAFTALFVATLITPIPGDELAVAILLGSRLALRTGARASASLGARTGLRVGSGSGRQRLPNPDPKGHGFFANFVTLSSSGFVGGLVVGKVNGGSPFKCALHLGAAGSFSALGLAAPGLVASNFGRTIVGATAYGAIGLSLAKTEATIRYVANESGCVG